MSKTGLFMNKDSASGQQTRYPGKVRVDEVCGQVSKWVR